LVGDCEDVEIVDDVENFDDDDDDDDVVVVVVIFEVLCYVMFCSFRVSSLYFAPSVFRPKYFMRNRYLFSKKSAFLKSRSNQARLSKYISID